MREQLNKALNQKWEEWEIPRELTTDQTDRHGSKSNSKSSVKSVSSVVEIHRAWWEARIARQKAIETSIATKAEFEFLYDKPHDDKSKVRVAGPFTVESVSRHRVLSSPETSTVMTAG